MDVVFTFKVLTTCSLIWMQRDFFLTAATPVVKVFLMLVALRRANCDPPSSPAIEPDKTVAPPERPINKPLIFFLQREGPEYTQNELDHLTPPQVNYATFEISKNVAIIHNRISAVAFSVTSKKHPNTKHIVNINLTKTIQVTAKKSPFNITIQ